MLQRAVVFICGILSLVQVAVAGDREGRADRGCSDDSWEAPAQAVQLFGNSWYVGTCGLSAILVTSAEGHVLIDGGTVGAAPLIEANIRRLGFSLGDVRYILNSHEHFDHAGGIAELQRLTGATVVARGPAATVLERGASDRSDPQFLKLRDFTPVPAVRRIADGELVRLGPLALRAHATPGHTPGGTSWTWRSCNEAGTCRSMVYADSLTAISDDEFLYTGSALLEALRGTLRRVASLDCDILVTTHPSASRLWSRLGPGASESLSAASACGEYAASARRRLQQRLRREAAAH